MYYRDKTALTSPLQSKRKAPFSFSLSRNLFINIHFCLYMYRLRIYLTYILQASVLQCNGEEDEPGGRERKEKIPADRLHREIFIFFPCML